MNHRIVTGAEAMSEAKDRTDRRMMMALVDMAADGFALYDDAGQLVHRNDVLTALFDRSGDRQVLEQAATRAAKAMSILVPRHEPATDSTVHHSVEISGEQFEIAATRAHSDDPLIVVRVHSAGTHSRPDDPLRRQGLTDREQEVAVLLALGTSSKEIAGELGVSLHTARRHCENVMRKLRVDSRGKVAARVLGLRHNTIGQSPSRSGGARR